MPMTEEEGTFHYNGVSVEDALGTWDDCGHVKKVTFDSSVTSIGKEAFYWCINL